MNLIKNNLLIKLGLVHLVSFTIVVQLCDVREWWNILLIDIWWSSALYFFHSITILEKKMCTEASWLDWTWSSQLPFSTSEVNTKLQILLLLMQSPHWECFNFYSYYYWYYCYYLFLTCIAPLHETVGRIRAK